MADTCMSGILKVFAAKKFGKPLIIVMHMRMEAKFVFSGP